jgi:SAM-dependent methyltransferase
MCADEGETTNLRSGAPSEYVLTKEWSGERERLSLLEATVDGFSIAALQAAGLTAGSRCLEIGAGSGSMARWMAHQTGDPALVTATDIDPRLLTPLASDGISVLEHNVVTDDFPPGSFDVIHTRTVLEHIDQREEVLDRVVPWLAPEGVLVIVDCVSYPVFSSCSPVYIAAMQAWVDVLSLTGTDYVWGRSFPEPLRRHGYRDVGSQAMVPTIQGGSPMARFWSMTLETLRDRILSTNLLSLDGLDEAQRLLADPDFWDLGPGFVAAWGRRPTSAPL